MLVQFLLLIQEFSENYLQDPPSQPQALQEKSSGKKAGWFSSDDETYRLSNATASEHDENHRPKQLGYKLSPNHHRFHLPPLKILANF